MCNELEWPQNGDTSYCLSHLLEPWHPDCVALNEPGGLQESRPLVVVFDFVGRGPDDGVQYGQDDDLGDEGSSIKQDQSQGALLIKLEVFEVEFLEYQHELD